MEDIFNKREIEIINYLNERNGFAKGSEIAKRLNVTDRTVRNEISDIKNILMQKSISYFNIISEKTKGYKLYITDADEFKKLSNKHNEDIYQASNIMIAQVRLYVLLKKEVSIENLCSVFYMSESVIKKLINNYPIMYEPNSIRTHIYMNKITISGNEIYIRNLIMREIFLDPYNILFGKELIPLVYNQEFETDIIKTFTRTLNGYKSILLSDRAIKYIIKYIYICKSRNILGNFLILTDSEESEINQYYREIKFTEELVQTQRNLTRNDILMIAACVVAFEQPVIALSDYPITTVNECKYLVDKISSITNNNQNKQNEYKALLDFMYGFKIRCRFSIHRKYMGNSRIKRRQITSVLISRIICLDWEKKLNLDISYEEVTLLGLYIANPYVCNNSFNARSYILIISKYGTIEANRMKEEIIAEYFNYIKEIDTFEWCQRNIIFFEKYDIILVDDERYKEELSKYNVCYYDSYEKIRNIPMTIRNSIRNETKNSTYFIEQINNNSFSSIHADCATDVLKDIANEFPNEKSEIFDNLFRMNSLCSFETGNSSAVITAMVSDIVRPIIKIIILENPIKWDHLSVQLVIVVFINHSPNMIGFCDEAISRLVSKKGNVNQIINDPKLETVKNVLNNQI